MILRSLEGAVGGNDLDFSGFDEGDRFKEVVEELKRKVDAMVKAMSSVSSELRRVLECQRLWEERNEKMERRVEECENKIKKLEDRVRGMGDVVNREELEKERNEQRRERQELRGEMSRKIGEKFREDKEERVTEWNNRWKEEREENKIEFREIMEEQFRQKAADEVIRVIKEKGNIVRDTVDKNRCLMAFGIKEQQGRSWVERERKLREEVGKILNELGEEGQKMDEVDVVYRIGKYKEGAVRPVKIKMRTQVGMEDVLARSGKLAKSIEYSNVWIKRDMSKSEREQERDLRNQAKQKNEQRTEEERKNFYWRVLDTRLRKWYIK